MQKEGGKLSATAHDFLENHALLPKAYGQSPLVHMHQAAIDFDGSVHFILRLPRPADLVMGKCFAKVDQERL